MRMTVAVAVVVLGIGVSARADWTVASDSVRLSFQSEECLGCSIACTATAGSVSVKASKVAAEKLVPTVITFPEDFEIPFSLYKGRPPNGRYDLKCSVVAADKSSHQLVVTSFEWLEARIKTVASGGLRLGRLPTDLPDFDPMHDCGYTKGGKNGPDACQAWFGDLNGDGAEDVIVTTGEMGNGSFTYAYAFEKTLQGWRRSMDVSDDGARESESLTREVRIAKRGDEVDVLLGIHSKAPDRKFKRFTYNVRAMKYVFKDYQAK